MDQSPITRRTALLMAGASLAGLAKSAVGWRVPILVYHRFGPVVADSMTVRTASFGNQLRVIRGRGLRITPLADVVRNPQSGSIALTADDGHRSVYSEMWPILKSERLPVMLFIYPSAISNASYAMTWQQLREMQRSGLISFGSHTFWHPNFRTEKKRRTPDDYRRFVRFQLVHSKEVLEQQLSAPIRFLAWPFGIYDDELIRAAEDAGYTAGFTIERRIASSSDNRMALPRFLMTELDAGSRLERLLCP